MQNILRHKVYEICKRGQGYGRGTKRRAKPKKEYENQVA
jgi:hypothetical protein